jgi:hypothetical protein
MVTLELPVDQVVNQVSTYALATELFRRMKRQQYVSLALIDLMEEYTDDLREVYASMEG